MRLPTGEVNVPVEPNSTPGHLKENLKYSLRVPPKFIRLTCEGRDLDDIKPLVGEPNNVADGAVLVAEAREGAVEDELPSAQASEGSKPAQQTIIKKEEPPKPKKPKKDVVRPTLGDNDVKKEKTLAPGYQPWKPEWLEGKQSKRHMAFFRLEAMDEKKSYPEQDDGTLAIALGDPHTSPVWTAAAVQLDLGEKAVFSINKKAIDFDPEGLNPTDSSARWIVELVRIVEVEDVHQDFSQLLQVVATGGSERAEELDAVGVHWRVRRWMAEGMFCIASSRERIAIMPGYGLVPIEDQHAPPVTITVGEGQQEAVELITSRIGPGGKGHLYLKAEALKGNRPAGCVIFDVELVAMDSCRGPGSKGWRGWASLVAERETGDQWLEEGDGRRKQLETFGTLRKSTGDSKDAEAAVSEQVHKFAGNATRRYRRALRWIEADNQEDGKIKLETATLQMRLAKASTLLHQRFGEEAEAEPKATELEAIKEAKDLAAKVIATAETLKNESLKYDMLKVLLQVNIQALDLKEARKNVDQLKELKEDEELRSDLARINRMETELLKKQGANTIETMKNDLAAAVEKCKAATGEDVEPCKAEVARLLEETLALLKGGEVTYDACKTSKIGKEVGNAMKLGHKDLATIGTKCVGEIQALAQKGALGL